MAVIGIVARLARIKNHEVLLRAYAKLRAAPEKKTRLVIVGDGPERASLEELSRQLGIAGDVSFLGERRDTPGLLSAFDIYVLPSFSEGMNLTLLEAMGAGLPVVASRVGGNVEIVEDGNTGYLFPSGNVDALSELLGRLVSEPERRVQMGQSGRERVLRQFDQRVMMQHYLSLYRGVSAGVT
jgi:glycosyltransferase involved in cell wall biosynthesis